MATTENKPLRHPLKSDNKGRFAENMADFSAGDMAKAIAEFEANKPVPRETPKANGN